MRYVTITGHAQYILHLDDSVVIFQNIVDRDNMLVADFHCALLCLRVRNYYTGGCVGANTSTVSAAVAAGSAKFTILDDSDGWTGRYTLFFVRIIPCIQASPMILTGA